MEFLPKELSFGVGHDLLRRLPDWHEAGVWDWLHHVLLAELHAAAKLDWSRAMIDSSHGSSAPKASSIASADAASNLALA